MNFDYSRVIKKSWEVAWKYKILWVFGFFAGAGGSNYNFRSSFSGGRDQAEFPVNSWAGAEQFLRQNLAIIVVIVGIVLFLILFFLVAKWLSKPALIKLAADADEVRPSFAQGLSVGWKFLWRFIGVGWLIWLPYIIFVVVPIVILLVLLVLDLAKSPPSFASLLPSLLAIGVAAIVAVVFAVPLSVLTDLSHRHLVLEDSGVRQAISGGWYVLKSNFGRVAVLWLIGVGLSIGAGIALFVLALVILVPGGAIAFGVIMAIQSKNLAFIILFALLAVIAAIVFFILVSLAQGLRGAFFVNYWTFAYLELTRAESPAA